MDIQKEQVELTSDEIKEMIKDLEPGTMLTLEIPEQYDSSDLNEHSKI